MQLSPFQRHMMRYDVELTETIEKTMIKFYDSGLMGRALNEARNLLAHAEKLNGDMRQPYMDSAKKYIELCGKTLRELNERSNGVRIRYSKRKI